MNTYTGAGYLRSLRRRGPRVEPWKLYEAKKAVWLARHPNASPAAYAEAMTLLARECGL